MHSCHVMRFVQKRKRCLKVSIGICICLSILYTIKVMDYSDHVMMYCNTFVRYIGGLVKLSIFQA